MSARSSKAVALGREKWETKQAKGRFWGWAFLLPSVRKKKKKTKQASGIFLGQIGANERQKRNADDLTH
jgi:hypothetical protein